MEIYKDYLNKIKTAMAADIKSAIQYSYFDGMNECLQKGYDIGAFLTEAKENKPLPSLQTFVAEMGLQPNYEQKLGSHPDFTHLKHSDQIEKHYITSMFIDIKNSTNLFKRYIPETVLIITNTIQRAAIHTCLIFGGYIQRLHGDGLFVYFGGKDESSKDATERALKAGSIFSYFIKNDLKNLFNEQGVETIFTRMGIDYGKNKDVVWAMAGMGEVSEVTTCSLHTSLASKMQGYAESNGIVVGDNVKDLVDLEYFTPVSKRTGNENDRYIFQIPEENLNYTQYDFDWLSYLKQQDFVATDLEGNLRFKRKQAVRQISENIKPIAEKSTPYLRK